MTITIAISTYNRLVGLDRLLNSISKIYIDDKILIRLVIADNSKDANAKEIFDKNNLNYRFEMVYHHVPKNGVVYPRNTTLLDALNSDSDYIVFIDDDEYVNELWLQSLLTVIEDTDAAVVSGGVKPKFTAHTPWWIINGKFFEIMDYTENVPIEYAHTSNAIVDLNVVRKLNIKFDEKYNLTGGEDTEFFDKIRMAGYKTVFTSKSWVIEEIVSERTKLSWLLKRWFRTGNTDAVIILRKNKSMSAYLIVLFGGMVRMSYGFICGLIKAPLLLIKKPDFFECLRIHSRGVGFIVSIFNYTLKEYKDITR